MGRYLLANNKYIKRTAEFTANAEAIACTVGDVIGISSDVVQWGVGGLVEEIINSTDLRIDREVNFVTGITYILRIKHQESDDITTHNFTVSGDILTDEITITSTTGITVNDTYAISEVGNDILKFRVVEISRDDEINRRVKAIEYNESILDYDYNNDIVQQINPLQVSKVELSDLTLEENLVLKVDGSIITELELAWDVSFRDGSLYTIQYKKTTETVYTTMIDLIQTNSAKVVASGLVEGAEYDFRVMINDNISTTTTHTFLGKSAKPDPINNLNITESGNLFNVTWEYPDKPLDFNEFIIYLDDVEIGRTTTNIFEYKSLGLSLKTFSVTAIDTTSNESDKVSEQITAERPSAPDTFYINNVQDAEKILTWTHTNKPDDLAGYEIRYSISGNRNWDDATSLVDILIVSSPYRSRFAQTEGEYLLMIKSVDTAGNVSANTKYIAFNQGETIIDNLVDSYDLKALGWQGTKTNMVVDSGNLVVNALDDLFYVKQDGDKFYYQDNEDLFYPDVYNYGSYEERGSSLVSGLGIINYTGEGEAKLYYREAFVDLMYQGLNDDLFYTDDDAELYQLSDYVAYTEPFNLKANVEYDTKVEYLEQQVQGTITGLVFLVDAPDVIETFDDVSILATNTIITSNKMEFIKNVNITIQDDAGTAETARILDKTDNTATIATYNSAGTKVTGTVDIIIKGYNT